MTLVVNGERIEDEMIEAEAQRMRPQYEKAFADEEPEGREARLREWARENAIEKTLLVQEARRDPRPVPAREIDRVLDEMKSRFGGEEAFHQRTGTSRADEDELRATIELRLRIDRVVEEVAGDIPPPSQAAIERYYEEHKGDLMAPEQVRAAHIVRHVNAARGAQAAQAELERVRQALEGGADFAEMAREHSDCPDNDGDLGCFARGQMVEEFEHMVFSMAVGQVSAVFPTRFGFHIAKVLDRKPPAPYALDEVRDHIVERLATEVQNKAMEKHLDVLRAKAAIEEA